MGSEAERFLVDFDQLAGRILGLAPRLLEEWQFSPTHDSKWEPLWVEYEDFELRRKALKLDRLDWQDDLEALRASTEQARDSGFTGHYPSAKDKFPLFYMLLLYEVKPGESMQVDRVHGWKTAKQSWTRFCERYASDDDFRATLSPLQKSSFKALREWWDASYTPTADISAFRLQLDELQESWSREGPFTRPPAGGWTSRSYYHSSLLELFIAEFHPLEWEPYASRSYLIGLLSLRRTANQHAVYMRFAYAMLQNTAPENHGTLPAYAQPARDSAWWKDNIFFQEPPVGDASAKQYRQLLDATAKPPTYLWDVAAKKTVRVSDFTECPEYLCISHTWGRWAESPVVWIEIPHVPWPVKSVTLYDVREVPDMLTGLGADYVWLDLFCIPQMPCQEQKDEVNNQAAIFRRASACVAWLNDIETWDVTNKALRYMAFEYIRTKSTLNELQPTDHEYRDAYDAAEGHAELLQPGSVEPSPWFSSLWTLQEAALCPALQLCTRTMKVLKDGRGTPISLTSLFTLMPEVRTNSSIPLSTPVTSRGLGWPNAVRCLRRLEGTTRLAWMLGYLTPMDIMVNANYRQCKRSRAPAIMSALDVLDWHKDWSHKDDKHRATIEAALEKRQKTLQSKGLPYNEAEELKLLPKAPLVLDTFPIEFVREAAQKIGSNFYSVLTYANSERIEIFNASIGGGFQLGSMMPFARSHGWSSSVYAAISVDSLARQDHESVAGWTIMEDATVRMPTAAVLASSKESTKDNQDIEAFLVIAERRNGQVQRLTDNHVNLRTKLRALAGADSAYYAVVLSHDFGTQYGIILQSSRRRIPLKRRHLVKVGLFKTYRKVACPPAAKVNWSVY